MIPADLSTAVLSAVFAGAAVHDPALITGLLAQAVAATAAGWCAARLPRRSRDHLEVVWPDGTIVLAVAWAGWLVLMAAAGNADPLRVGPVTACFLLVLGAGWRCLYGFAKAHDSIVPKPVQRRLDAQEADGGRADQVSQQSR